MPTIRSLLRALPVLLLANPAGALTFAMPLQCEYGKTCFIQNYVDDDTTSAAQDYRCGNLTYNGHKGTDIRLTNFAAMAQGANVLAAADGNVLRLRNDAPDTGRDAGPGTVAGKECGNGLIIAHAEGYETQYCHMKRGSIAVQPGQQVRAGDVLGQVGYSGDTEFPHLHFQITHHGAIMDPFNALPPGANPSCATPTPSLWSMPLPYIPTAILSAGFSNSPPQRDNIRTPLIPQAELPAASPMLIFWVEIMGIQPGDILTMRILAPDGSVVAEKREEKPTFKAVFFQFIGKKYHAAIPIGSYRGTIRLDHTNGTHTEQQVTIVVK